MTGTDDAPRWPGRLEVASGLLLLAALLLLARALPLEALASGVQRWIGGLGVWGPIAFAGLYALGTVLFLPGSALTLAGGAAFGLATGTIAALAGATIGAALAFLIARYFARERVERLARSNRTFAAIDRAIAKGGWKIVAMLRLSPAMPFNVQNYFYGVTAIRFWPCVLTSFVFMAPGAFLYVYLGHLAGQGLAAASGGGGRPAGQWILLGVGLVATAAVTVYVTKLARKALQEQAELPERDEGEDAPRRPASPRRAIVAAVVAALAFGLASFAYGRRDSLQRLLAPGETARQSDSSSASR